MHAPKIALCPFLPKPKPEMSYRSLREFPVGSSEFYFNALQYSHFLWLQGKAGRSILALARGLYSPIPEQDLVLQDWPLPYTALGWITANHSSDDFPGNPRISFQHQASRLQGERIELRRARAWAAWEIVKEARPSLADDPQEKTHRPNRIQIAAMLAQHGFLNEKEVWEDALIRLSEH